ncbi:MAG: hypothetical protein Kow00108_24610 [Calditrichia bacterium]
MAEKLTFNELFQKVKREVPKSHHAFHFLIKEECCSIIDDRLVKFAGNRKNFHETRPVYVLWKDEKNLFIKIIPGSHKKGGNKYVVTVPANDMPKLKNNSYFKVKYHQFLDADELDRNVKAFLGSLPPKYVQEIYDQFRSYLRSIGRKKK